MTKQRILNGDVLAGLRSLPDACVQCVVTSPPYWGLRNYCVDGQIGLEPTPEEHVAKMVDVFREVWRVLRDVPPPIFGGFTCCANQFYSDTY